MELITILISSMIINNIVLIQFLGLCSFFGVSNKMSTVFGMSAAVVVVIFLSSLITYPLSAFILEPLGIGYIETIAFILVIAALVQLTELIVKRTSKSLYKALGVYLPLIATNCAVLGVALTNVSQPKSFMEAMVYALGSGLGYALIIITFTAIRMRLETASVPKAMKGLPIAMMTAGLMALAFLGLAGII
jgi:electron transport complex protein RnfA